jgi:hypothetical protein
MVYVDQKLKGVTQMNKSEIFLKAAQKMRRPCSSGVMINKRFIAALLRLRVEKRKGLDKAAEK